MSLITNNNLKSTVALAALEMVVDPEIGLNVVDLGLIYQLDFDETTNTIHCAMTLTTQFCPMGESITNAVCNTLESAFPGNSVIVQLTFEPRWNSEMISAEGQKFLNGQ